MSFLIGILLLSETLVAPFAMIFAVKCHRAKSLEEKVLGLNVPTRTFAQADKIISQIHGLDNMTCLQKFTAKYLAVLLRKFSGTTTYEVTVSAGVMQNWPKFLTRWGL